MNKQRIMERLQEHLNYAIDLGYNKNRILGIFLYGSQNYNFANDESDIDSKIILLPSFSDLCLLKSPISKEIILKNGEHIDIKDIRLYRENLMKQNINYTETLYTEYYIINPDYKELFNKYFFSQRETIINFDRKKTIKSICGQLLHSLNQNPTDNKKLYNAERLLFFLKNYLKEKSYFDCLHPQDEFHKYLWDLKYGKLDICDNNERKTKLALKLQNEAKKILDESENIKSPLQEKAKNILDTGTTEILKKSFNMFSEKKEISKKDFFKQLTHAEERAYYSIVQEIHEEGNITISKLVDKNRISRPVYNNLLVKMKENNIAIITNMGMKGTHIKILNTELKAEIIDL